MTSGPPCSWMRMAFIVGLQPDSSRVIDSRRFAEVIDADDAGGGGPARAGRDGVGRTALASPGACRCPARGAASGRPRAPPRLEGRLGRATLPDQRGDELAAGDRKSVV